MKIKSNDPTTWSGYASADSARNAQYQRLNKDRVNAYARKYRRNNPHKVAAFERARQMDVRGQQKRRCSRKRHMAILDFFGGKCVRCGFCDARALQYDHIHGGGAQHRRTLKLSMDSYLWKLIKQDPEQARGLIQLLCANCNWIKRSENHEYRTKYKAREL